MNNGAGMDSIAPPATVERICDAIGRRQIADAIGVRLTSVSNAVADGRFPARWYYVLNQLASDAGLQVPHHLFSFVGVDVDEHAIKPEFEAGAISSPPGAGASSSLPSNPDGGRCGLDAPVSNLQSSE